jgi:LPPG:FO 2-phospho-L-lactate transferase
LPAPNTPAAKRLLSIGVKVTVLVGGVGGARFLLGVQHLLSLGQFTAPGDGDSAVEVPPPGSGGELTAIVNVGDDAWMHGVRICPDLDTCMYTLGGGIDPERGWGRAKETWTVREELAAYDAEPSWFSLGDRDIATHLVRTRMLRAGYRLSDVVTALCHRWQPGVTLLPGTDDRVETHVVVDDPATGPQARKAIHFQEWWVRHRAELPAHRFVPVGADEAVVLPAAREAVAEAHAVLLAPSNPVVSIGALLEIPGMREALAATPARVVGLSPIVGGRPVRGMADACLTAIGVETTAEAVGRHYGARSGGGLLDGWLVHTGDRADVPGVDVRTVPLLMSDVPATAAMARAALDLCGVPVG